MIRLQGVGRVQARNRFYLITFVSMCWRDRLQRVIVALSTAVGLDWVGGQVLATDVLHGFPVFECGLDRQEICMFAVVRVLLDGSACPRKATTARQPNCIFSENLRQGARELVANC